MLIYLLGLFMTLVFIFITNKWEDENGLIGVSLEEAVFISLFSWLGYWFIFISYIIYGSGINFKKIKELYLKGRFSSDKKE